MGFGGFSSQVPLLLCLRLVRQAMKIPTFDVVSWFLFFFVWGWGWVVGFGGFSSQIPLLLCLRLVRQAMKIPTFGSFDVVSWFLWWIFITNSAFFVSSLGSTSNENPCI